jgi:DNA-binding response OmpR family regulator
MNLGPGPDGWEVARRARELNNALPVVYARGASGHEWQSNGVAHSILITKPFTMKQLVNAISMLLKKGRLGFQL